MIPHPAFRWTDEPALRDFIAHASFALIAVAVEGRVMTAQAPLAFDATGALAFHLARNNAIVPHLDGRPVIATVLGEQGYISPDWYGTDDQVPTWNYRLAEIEGMARRLDDAALVDQLDRLSAAQEALLAPKAPWTRDKMNPTRFAAMTKAITGFAITDAAIRGTAKFGQNKSEAEAAGAIAALRAIGRDDLASSMENAR
ncbi:FMN-binding negative transcriptional regulator [Sphingomonas sp. AP4-R1]|uniref:FMN-binding negative transcriptional regulator n=1 Tax=Sphingomonas sp. AP4-R1 TaxID=2735134 RepID=UPI001493B688|nr:FMN-binding negative transcriptional regulator [Sphingomonas sp. AP4-R1]QJU58628.1 FMN-binding negative transcriptional regulator [Sphingomonas sp. AP4-R1]